MNEKDDSLPQSGPESAGRSGMRVEASPFNGVKLDLGIIIVVLLLLWLVLGRTLADDGWLQAGILFLCSALAAGWIIYRVRRILLQHAGDRHGSQ